MFSLTVINYFTVSQQFRKITKNESLDNEKGGRKLSSK